MTRTIGLLAIGLALLDVAILAALSAWSFDLNDHMYAAAPLASGALYRDVHFVQGPVTFHVLKAIASFLPQGFVYPGLRVASAALLLATLFVGAFACIDRWPSRCLFLAFAGTNIYFIYPGLEIGSYSLPLFLLALATASLWKIDDRSIAIGAAALLIGLAASAKLNHVLFFLPLAGFVLLEKRRDESRAQWARATLVPFAIGGLIGSLPVLVAFAQAPHAFVLNTLIFHSSFSLAALNHGSTASFTHTFNVLTDWASAGGAAFVALGVYVAVVDRDGDPRRRHFLLFGLLAAIAGLIAAISPGVTYVQYWAPTTFFTALVAARFLDRARVNLGLISVLAVLPLVTVGARELRNHLSNDYKATGGRPKVAVVMAVNRQLKAYALRVNDSSRCDNRIFSLAGAFVVDSGFALSRHMEGGTFWSWVSAEVPARYIDDKNYHLDAYTIFPERWVRDQRLNFLLLGYYPGHTESDLESYVAERKFSVVELPSWNGLTLKFYYDPDCIKPKS